MSKYDHASLVMIPSGFKAEKLYSVLPENGNGDFTHDRNGSTATRVNKDGYVETVSADVPRLDYPLVNGVVQDCPHLLLEPQRTNVHLYHNLMLETSTQNSSKNANTTDVLSPANDNTAVKVTTQVKTSTGVSGISARTADGFTYTHTASTDYIGSVFAKKGTFDWIKLTVTNAGTPEPSVFFNISTGAVGTESDATGFIEDFGNGWYRCAIKYNLGTRSDLSGRVLFRFADGDGNDVVSRTGTEHMYLWGAQLEEGSYPTSLIQTSGSAETRSADVCNGAGTSAEFNDSEGVLFVEIQALADDGTSRRITVTDDSGANYNNIVSLELDESTNNLKGFVSDNSGNITSVSTTNFNQNENNKIALKYNSASTNLYVNGSEVDSATSTNLPTGLIRLDFDSGRSDEIYNFYGKVKQVAVFNKALTDSELEQITSWRSFNDMATGLEYTIR